MTSDNECEEWNAPEPPKAIAAREQTGSGTRRSQGYQVVALLWLPFAYEPEDLV